MKKKLSGPNGCCARTSRCGIDRFCKQKAMYYDEVGNGWCYYHEPGNPKKFGQGYLAHPREKPK